ncbi:hypothetical protein HHI36_019180 [Cryptolaemus montrouzieri]|uniref:Uncharacterized protein n=1 Tax=Cryptolaemus montrouzieri TaxID=559131 RepID=A0ABD2P2W8_9CUCU
MSTAMRSTLQTVPESLEVTKNADATSGATTGSSGGSGGGSNKTTAKATSEINKPTRAYNFQTSTNKQVGMKTTHHLCDRFNLKAIGLNFNSYK